MHESLAKRDLLDRARDEGNKSPVSPMVTHRKILHATRRQKTLVHQPVEIADDLRARGQFIVTTIEVKNDLCAPLSTPDVVADWLRDMLSDLQNGRRWATEKTLRPWIAEHRLSGGGFRDTGAASSPDRIRILERVREARPRAAANLARLVADLDRPI